MTNKRAKSIDLVTENTSVLVQAKVSLSLLTAIDERAKALKIKRAVFVRRALAEAVTIDENK